MTRRARPTEAAINYKRKRQIDPYCDTFNAPGNDLTRCARCGKLVVRRSLWPTAKALGQGHECR